MHLFFLSIWTEPFITIGVVIEKLLISSSADHDKDGIDIQADLGLHLMKSQTTI